jgi:zinc protease
VAARGVTESELSKTREQIEVSVIRSRDGTYNLASSLGEAVASANWKWFVQYIDNMKQVTPADVKRVAATYFVPDHATVGWFEPIDPSAAPAVAASEASKPAEAESRKTPAKTTRKSASVKGQAPAVGASFASRTTRRVLPNGIRLDIVENHSVPTVSVQALLLSGGMTAPTGAPSVPYLASEMVQRGTTTRNKNEIAALLDKAGAQLSFFSNLQETIATASGLSRDTQLLLELLADEILHPSFPDSELVKAKSEYRSVVLRNAENTSLRAFDRLTQVVYPDGHPYRSPTAEEMIASVEKVTVEDLRRFHAERYVGSGLVIAVVGDVEAAKVVSMVEKLFGSLPAGTSPTYDLPRASVNDPLREAVTLRGKANMNLIYGHASGLRRSDPDYEAALLANAAVGQTSLSSRIGKRVRDTEGLSYSLSSRFNMTDYLDGVWSVNVAVAPANLNRAMASTLDEVQKYVREGITPEELESQKSFFAGNYRVRLGSNAGVAGALLTAEKFGYGPEYLDQFPERIKRVTLEETNAAIKKYLHPDKLHVVVAGDLEKIPE